MPEYTNFKDSFTRGYKLSIPGIQPLTFEQAFSKAPIAKDGSHEKYIAKDFILELGCVKIKLKASDSLRDVIRKINLKSHVTGLRAKAVKGKLTLELTRTGRAPLPLITLPKKDSGEGFPVDANQIIANYLASLPSKISTGIQVWDEVEHNLYLLNELPQLGLDEDSDEELSINNFDVDNISLDHQGIDDSDQSDNEGSDNNIPQIILLQNLAPNVTPVKISNYDKYIKKLTQPQRHKLEVVMNKKLLAFKNTYPEKNIVPKNALLKDKLVFCLKEIKNNRMSPFPRTSNL